MHSFRFPGSFSLLLILSLAACGTEEETINDSADTGTVNTTDSHSGLDDTANEVGDSSSVAVPDSADVDGVSTCPDGPEAPLGIACATENLLCPYGYDVPGCGGRTVICSDGVFIEESHTDPSAECFADAVTADAVTVDAGSEPGDVMRNDIFVDHCVFNEGFMCPAGCFAMYAFPYDADAACVDYEGTEQVGCTNLDGGTDDAPCVRRLSDGAFFLATSGSAFAASDEWEFCGEVDGAMVQGAEGCGE